MFKSLFRLVFYAIIGLSLWFGYQMYRNGEFPWLRSKVETAARQGAVLTALSVNKHLAERSIEVRIRDSVVILEGQVANDDERAKAVEIAGAVPGVQGVDDQLTLDPSLSDGSSDPARSLGQRIDDATLHAKILGSLKLDRDLARSNPDITVRDGEVEVRIDRMERAKRSRLVERIEDIVGVVSVRVRSTESEDFDIVQKAMRVTEQLSTHAHLGEYALRLEQQGPDAIRLTGEVTTFAERELAELIVTRELKDLTESGELSFYNEIRVNSNR